MRQNSNFHLLREAYQQVLNESSLPPIGPGVCYFETEKALKQYGVGVETTTGKWNFIEKDRKPIGILSVDDNGKMDGKIVKINLTQSRLTKFDGSGLSALTSLNLGGNRLTSFDCSGLSALAHLYLNDNKLTSFDPSGLSAICTLYLSNNKLTSVDLSGLPNLTGLFIGKVNPFHSLEGPAVILPDGTKEYWVDGKKCDDEHDYEVAKAKYLRPQEADKAMEKFGLKGLFNDI
jgi:hypothetical protein